MKKILTITLVLLAFKSDKTYTLTFSEKQLGYHLYNMAVIKNILNRSNLPHNEVMFSILALDSLKKDIIKQMDTQKK
jgi:hypothetical protein